MVTLDELQALFIQNVSHEFRTPLSMLLGYAELLRSGELGNLSPEQLHAMKIIVNHTQELRILVERIGVLLSAHAHATVSTPISLAEIASEVVKSRRAAAQQAGLTLKLHLEPELPPITGDPFQLQPALDCLLDNALKFTPRGGWVELEAYAEPGWACVAVTDTGIGLAEKEIERVFCPFYQVDGSSTRHYRGMGLGLSVVKAVVDEHGGHIDVDSKLGQGSRFTLKLPAMLMEPKAEQSVMENGKPRRILVVDDEENVALTIQASLEKLPNCEVTVATSGREVLQLFEQHPYDLLITDYKMPGTDGITLSSNIRQLYPRTPIIMITAYSSHLLLQQASDVSIRCVLDKPVKLDEIRSVALEALENNPGEYAG